MSTKKPKKPGKRARKSPKAEDMQALASVNRASEDFETTRAALAEACRRTEKEIAALVAEGATIVNSPDLKKLQDHQGYQAKMVAELMREARQVDKYMRDAADAMDAEELDDWLVYFIAEMVGPHRRDDIISRLKDAQAGDRTGGLLS